jgi:hypothetical protein
MSVIARPRIEGDNREANPMSTFRVPYPGDPEQRRALFERAASALLQHGEYQGDPDSGSFRGMTPVGGFAGHYRSPAGSDFIEIELTEKPWLVPTSMVEHEVRRFLTQV